ncbi:hypothetical protein BGZ67_004937, partial [Mortierella alpina]
QCRHCLNPLYRVAPFVQTILDDLSDNNKIRLLHQRFRPAIELSVQHWPRAVVGILSTRILLTSSSSLVGSLIGMGEPLKWCYHAVRSMEILPVVKDIASIGGLTLIVVAISGSQLFELVSNIILALRWDKPVRHAEIMYKHCRRSLCFWTTVVVALLIPASLLGANIADELDPLKDLWTFALSGVECGAVIWGLRTLIKDLKGEPRTWWGGEENVNAIPHEEEAKSDGSDRINPTS